MPFNVSELPFIF